MKRSKKANAEERLERNAALLKMRFEATIYPGRKAKTKDWADDLNVDRVPDAKGRVRALITIEDLVRLLDQGVEVRLYRAHAYEPLDPALIVTDRSFKRWLDEQVRTLKANPGPKPFHEP
ncbi:MAG: hypothetical protein IPM55_21560 [Acidobacteria bacterium]|nr:hypothetical protein [Acidobacteriota bacterium]